MAAPKTADQEFNERYDGVGVGTRDAGDTRRRLSGRDRGNRQDSTRNVRTQARTSTMPGAPKNNAFATDKRDIATEFNESYSKKGIQPSYVANENAAPKQQSYQQPEQITRSEQYQQVQEEVDTPPPPAKQTYKRRKKIRKKLGPRSAFAKARATSVNIWVWSWGLWAWFFFQLPFAVISLLFAALTEFVYQLFVQRTLFKSTEPGLWAQAWNVLVDGVAKALSVFASIVISIMEWMGIDLSIIAPANVFMITYIVTLAIGWFTLILIYFQYKVAFLRPLSGEGAGMKMGMCLLAIVGYATPIANLFPWFIFWTMAVWWNPK